MFLYTQVLNKENPKEMLLVEIENIGARKRAQKYTYHTYIYYHHLATPWQ